MKILLTGATGFLGRRLLRGFVNNSHEVIITRRTQSNIGLLGDYLNKVKIWNIEELDLTKLFSIHPDINVIIHAATDYGHNDTTPTKIFWTNEHFPLQLLEHAIEHKVNLFINMDTFFNTGKADYEYLKGYTLSKRHFQEWGKYCAEIKKIAFANLRLFHLYGPFDNSNKFVPTIVRRCLAGEKIDLTDGMQERDFIHIDDVVNATNIILGKSHELGYYHYDVGTGHALRLRDFVEHINKLCNRGATLNFGVLPTRKGEPLYACAATKELNALGWQPQINLNEGLLSVVNEFRN